MENAALEEKVVSSARLGACGLNRVKEGSINIVYDSTRNSVNTNMPGSSVLSKETNRSSEFILQEIFNATKNQTLHLLTALFLL